LPIPAAIGGLDLRGGLAGAFGGGVFGIVVVTGVFEFDDMAIVFVFVAITGVIAFDDMAIVFVFVAITGVIAFDDMAIVFVFVAITGVIAFDDVDNDMTAFVLVGSTCLARSASSTSVAVI
jgi:hypothetical protein